MAELLLLLRPNLPAKRGQAVAQASLDMDDLPATPRKSLEELDADEARYLAERAAKKDTETEKDS